jgi:hypothetical protein
MVVHDASWKIAALRLESLRGRWRKDIHGIPRSIAALRS